MIRKSPRRRTGRAKAHRGRLWLEGNSFATASRLYKPIGNVGAQAMSTATGHGDMRPARPASSEPQRDLYDPHFPARKPEKEASGRVRDEVFNPYFPARVRQ